MSPCIEGAPRSLRPMPATLSAITMAMEELRLEESPALASKQVRARVGVDTSYSPNP